MSQPLRIPNPKTPLHLYRHLLREASYLPPIARPYIDKQIQARFRRNREQDVKDAHRFRMGSRDLRVLRAANFGDIVRMRKVLLRAFGRVGRRRRELMADLLRRDKPANTEELEQYAAKAAAVAAQDRKWDWLDAWDIDKLRAFARSQCQAELVNSPKPSITNAQTSPEKTLPTENSWGRPLPVKLARTKLKKLWKAVADKCMPPLPREEWEALGGVVEGTVQAQYVPPPRRPVARYSASPGDQPGSTWNWQSYAVKPVAVVDRPANRRNKLLTGAVDDNTPTGDPQPINCHKYTARTWRRLLAGIWQLTATMEPRPDGRGWKITWGKLGFEPPKATGSALEFFSNLPEPAARRGGKKKR